MKPWHWILAVAAALVVVFVGGPFVYIHFIEGKAPAPLSLSSPPTTSTPASGVTSTSSSAAGVAPANSSGASASAGSVDGTWKVTTGSQAGYRIKETLFGQSNTAVGRTSSVTGSMNVSGTSVTAATFSVDMTTVSSDRSQRDNQFQGRIMDTSTYPTATFKLTKPILLGSIPAEGVVITEQATGDLTMHGTTKSVTFPVQARRNGSTIQASGSIPIVFADYNIENPSGGPATTEDHGILEFLLNFSQS